jgi:uncharacterized protein (TIGR02266 family)
MRERELREFPRVPVHLAVEYADGQELASCYIQSLSEGGVFVRTSRPLPIGTDVLMEIRVGAEGAGIRIRGQVVWERLAGRDDGMGLRFLDPLPPALRQYLPA